MNEVEKKLRELEKQGKRHSMKQGRKAISTRKRTFEIYLDVFISRPNQKCGCAITPPPHKKKSWSKKNKSQKFFLTTTKTNN